MKFLLLLFLVGFAAASFHEQLEDPADDEYLELMQELQNAEDDTTGDVGKRLRETLDDILEKIKDSIDQGKNVKDELVNKVKEIREKMKELKVDLGQKAKELLGKLREHIKNIFQKLLDKLKDGNQGTSEAEVQMVDFNLKEMFKKLKDALLAKIDKEKLKAKIEEIFGKGSVLADDLLKLLNDKGLKYKEKLLDLIDRYLKKEQEKRSVDLMLEFAEDDTTGDVGKRLRQTLDEILEKIKDSIDQGKNVKDDLVKKVTEIRERMKELKVDLGQKAKELLQKVRNHLKDVLQKILDKLTGGNQDTSETEVLMADFNMKEMFKKLKDLLLSKIDKEKLKAKIEELFGKGSALADDLMKLLNDKGLNYKEKLLALIDRYLKRDQEKRSVDEMIQSAEDDIIRDIGNKLRETFDEIVEKIKESIDKGKGVREDLLEKLSEIREQMKALKVDLGHKAKELLEKVREHVKGYWRKLVDKLREGNKDTSEAEIQMSGFNLKEMFKKLKEQLLAKIDKEKLKAKIEEIFGKGSVMADDLLRVLNEKGEKYKQKLLDLVDRFLKKDEEKRSVDMMLEFAEDDETKTELGNKLRKALDDILQRIKDTVNQGKVVKEDLLNKFKDIIKKMTDLKVKLSKETRQLLERVKELVQNYWKQILEDLLKGGNDKETSAAEVQRADLKEMFKKLKKTLLSKIDKEKLKAKIEEIFGKGSEMADSLVKMINEKGDKIKQKLLDLVDRYLDQTEKEKRSVKEMWEKVKDYFKNLQIDLKEKYMKFGEWVKTVADKALKKGQDKMENIRSIAREFVEHTKGVSKEVAVEALEFLKPYKQDLGSLWDQVKEAVKDIVQRKD